jgi:MarR family 2-MHQ and catechol resistance regulon transcriptional repressor
MGERYLKSVRLLAECLQGFERYSGESVRHYGLTHAQFDIIATLGNTPGMSYKELGERTLISNKRAWCCANAAATTSARSMYA